MKLKSLPIILSLTGCLLMVALGAVKVDFSGKWVMDPSQSQGIPPGRDQIMTVTQNGDQISVVTRVMPPEGPSITLNDDYIANGEEVEFTQRPNGQGPKGKRIVKWSADGRGLEVAEKIVANTPQGPMNTEVSRKWALAADGKTLSIETVSKDQRGETKNLRVFVKK